MDLADLVDAAMRSRATGGCPLKAVCPHAAGKGTGCLIARSVEDVYRRLGLEPTSEVAERPCTQCSGGRL